MKKHLLFIIAGSLFFFLSLSAAAQESNLLHFMNTTPQALRSNPANFPDSMKMYFGVPFLANISVGAGSPLSWSDIFVHRRDSLFVNRHLASIMPDNSHIFADFNYDIFTYGQRFGNKYYITVGLTAKGYGDIGLPKDIVTLLVNGNAAFTKKPLELDASFFGIAYGELSFGYGYHIDKHWTLSGRIKLLGGVASAYSESLKATLTTAPDTYNMTGTTDILFKTAQGNILENLGVGLDAGVYFKTPLQGLEVGLSFIDWGFIRWNTNITEHKGVKNDQSISVSSITDIASSGDVMKSFLDTLKNQLDLEKRDGDSFSTVLPGRLFFSASYNVSPNDRIGFLFRTDVLQHFNRSGITIMYNRLVSDWFSVSAGNNFIFGYSAFNPSIAMNFSASTFQFYIAIEDFHSFYLRDMNGARLQLGMAIALY
ncbi:MAG: DUF5723 family protein [Prevotellaceae bacterium]|jgi:hypothetical protein|nr:DUF5723 family protein [Prevotellaceae bacterium]